MKSFLNLLKSSNLISKLAKQSSEIKEYKEEFRIEFFLLKIAKFFISIISVLTAFNYFTIFLTPLLKEFSHITSAIALVILEVSTALATIKFFKFLLRGRVVNAAIFFVCTVCLFGLSFVVSTNGIAELTSEVKTEIKEINNLYDIEKSNLIIDYDNQINELKENITLIKKNPAGWSGGKRSCLTKSQLNDIKGFSNAVVQLRANKTKELQLLKNNYTADKENDLQNVTNEASKFYFIVGVILFIQLIASFIISFLSTNIYKKDHSEVYQKQDIFYDANLINQHLVNTITNLRNDTINKFLEQQQLALTMDGSNLNGNVINERTVKENEPKKEVKKVGFTVPKSTVLNGSVITVKNDVTERCNDLSNSTVQNDTKNVGTVKKCLYCGADISHKKHHAVKYCNDDCRKKNWLKNNPKGHINYYKKK